MWTRAARIHDELPVFRIGAGERLVVYTPGHLAVVGREQAESLQRSLQRADAADGAGARLAAEFRRLAETSRFEWQRIFERPFEPECLTLYLSNHCNLDCTYCFTRLPGRNDSDAVIPIDAVEAGANIVARNCRNKGKPLTVVVHGGGEPTLHWTLLRRIVESTRAAASREGIGWSGAIVTNGCVPEDRATWLANNFSLLELSCDGPPDVQERQRPARDGRESAGAVERTARIFSRAPGRFVVRTTITPESVERQAGIVKYVASVLGAKSLRFEPAYRVRQRETSLFRSEQAGWFVEHFLRAQERAAELNVDVGFAGSRLDELHGPYCDVLRNALHLTPQGTVTGCFFCFDGSRPALDLVQIGGRGRRDAPLTVDDARAERHRRQVAHLPALCKSCFNQFHCARECPERCYADPASSGEPGPCSGPHSPEDAGFRCRVQRLLGEAWIRQAAGLEGI